MRESLPRPRIEFSEIKDTIEAAENAPRYSVGNKIRGQQSAQGKTVTDLHIDGHQIYWR